MGLGRCTKGPIWGYERWRIYKVIFHQEYGSGKPQVGHSYSPEVEAPRTAVAVVGKGHTLESFWGSMLLVIFFGELVPLAPKA